LRQAFPRRVWTGQGSFVLAASGLAATGILAMLALETPEAAFMVIAGATAAALLASAVWLLPLWASPRRLRRPQVEALRDYLASGEPLDEEERTRLTPYAVALDAEWAKGLDFTERAPDKAPALPTHPLPHKRSAAA
jgi:hypothetical protein